ncbi:MAG: argininosuccinate synthase [Cyclobacteriaceae bacterium]
MSNKVVLAFSGGLDTSYCVKYLSQDKGLEVHGVLVNTGGFDDQELSDIEARAKLLGVKTFTALNVEEEFYKRCVRYLIFGNVLKNNTYPLSVSAERVFQAMAIAKHAKLIKADYIAHGSTGAGNDQVRFDMIFHTICPESEIITPIRDQNLSRQAEIDFLKKHGINFDWEKARYSINQGLWGTSVGGAETLTSDKYLPEEAFPSKLRDSEPQEIEIDFVKGEPVGLNGDQLAPVELIKRLNNLGSDYAIGRDIHVGDTIIGIKGRVGFEAPAPLILVKAHHTLEKHVLTKWQLQLKEQLTPWYGNLVHEGQFMEPALRDIEAYLENSQRNVTGKVKVQLNPHRFHVVGIESVHDLMNSKFGAYGEINLGWTGEDVKGFSKIFGNQSQIYYQVNKHEFG